MAQFALDTFTAANATKITARNADSGQAWGTSGLTTVPGTAQGPEIISNEGRAAVSSGEVYCLYLNATPPSADYTVSLDVKFGGDGSTDVTGAGLRIAGTNVAASSYGYFITISPQGGGFRLSRRDSVGPVLATVTTTITAGVTYRMLIGAIGSNIYGRIQRLSDSLWLTSGGAWQASQVNCMSVTESTYAGAGFPGLITYGAGSRSTFDNFSADTAGGGPTISVQPTNQTVASGAAFTFSVTAAASGGGTLSYQWKKNGVAIGGATSASYSGTAGTNGISGDVFLCDVTETGGTSPGTVSSSSATLTVSVATVKLSLFRFYRQKGNPNV